MRILQRIPRRHQEFYTNLWIERFECGFWMGDYVDEKYMQYTEHMLVDHSRIL